jgi:UDP-N-acetyl-D-mannosaminuronate dehydrogenase
LREAAKETLALDAQSRSTKRLAVLGLSYKGETDDIGESPAIEIVKKLLSEGVRHEF